MSHKGQSRRFRYVRATSALPPIATINRTCRQVGSVPEAAIDGRLANQDQNAPSYGRHELFQHGLYLGLAFERAVLATLELNPAFVEAIEHLRAGRWVLHALRSE